MQASVLSLDLPRSRGSKGLGQDFSGKQRIRIADILLRYYEHTDAYGKHYIQPLPEIVREVFGQERLTQYPVFPRKKLRDYFMGEAYEDILKLLGRLSQESGEKINTELVDPLNDVLVEVGLKLDSGKILTLGEVELKLPKDEETFLSSLDMLGYQGIKSTFSQGMEELRSGDTIAASSNCCLAFDGLFKELISAKGGNSNQSLGNLVTEGLRLSLIEPETEQVFRGFVSLRNKAPQHASPTGSVAPLSKQTAEMLAHLARVLMAYLLNRAI